MTTFAPPAADLPLVTDRVATTPLTAQITTQLRAALSGGHLVAGERLPSTRSLAATLGVSRTVVTTAYAQLFAEGWLDGRHGSGTYVADGAPGVPAGLPAMAGSAVPVAEKGLAPAGAWQQSADDAEPPLNLRPGIPWTAG